jgi:hypothetical protein
MALSPEQFGKDELYHAEPMSSAGHFLKEGWVHVGTRGAALARVHPANWEDEAGPHGTEYAKGRSRLWRTQLRSGASVGPLITDDTAGRIEDGRGPSHASMYDVHPYVNEYEDPGSVSYIARADALTHTRPVGSGPGFIKAQIDSENRQRQ